MQDETIIKQCFMAWQQRYWETIENLLTDDFTFTSLYDNHINKQEYKQKCWNTVKDIAGYKYMSIMEQGNEVFVRCKTASTARPFKTLNISSYMAEKYKQSLFSLVAPMMLLHEILRL